MAMTPEQKRKEEERRKRIAEERARSGGFLERKAEPLTQKEKGLTKRRMIDEFEQATHKARREGREAPYMEGGKMIVPKTEAEIREQQKEQIAADPSKFGYGGEEVKPEGMETIEKGGEVFQTPQGEYRKITKPDGTSVLITPTGEELPISTLGASAMVEEISGQVMQAGTGAMVGATAWKVGGKLITNPKKVMQAGTALKNSVAAKAAGMRITDYIVGGYALLKTGEGLIGYFTGRKIDEQQQAVNTLGMMATTIAGDSMESVGDWRKGMAELDYIYGEVLRLEQLIKTGGIQEGAIKYNGKIYDINADMEDQLRNIDEQRRILRSFVVEGVFPELTPLEIQGIIRELEAEGHIKPVDLTTARRKTE